MNQQENLLDMRRFWRQLKQIKWIALALVIAMFSAACYYSVTSLTKSTIEGSILIGDDTAEQNKGAGGMVQMMKTFSVGGFGASTVDNEVLILKSHDVMLRTVRSLGLNRSYIGKKPNGDKAMLYHDTPVRIEAPVEYFDTLQTAFALKIELTGDDKADIKVVKGMFGSVKKEINGVSIPGRIETPYGVLQIMKTDAFAQTPFKKITVNIAGNDIAADNLAKTVDIVIPEKLSDIIDVDLDWANAKQGIDIVNGIMNEYNGKRLDRMHENASSSINYYDERIASVFADLQKAEQAVAEYQRDNKLMGVDSETELLVGTAYSNRLEIIKANNDIAYYEMVLNILRTRLDEDVMIPNMESLMDPNIAAFNELITERTKLRRSATENNDMVKLINKRIDDISKLIIENSEKMIAKAKSDVALQQKIVSNTESRLGQYPGFEQDYVALMREKSYQNQLYQYLISERENEVLKLYSQSNIGFVYQPAFILKKGSILKKIIIPVAALIFAIFMVVCLALFLLLFSRKVKDPMDIAFIGIDSRAVKYTGNREDINRLRTMLTADPARRVLYYAPLGDSASLGRTYADALTAIGRSVEIIDGLSGNDEVMTPEVASRIKTALSTTDYVIVTVPVPDDVRDIENLVDADDAALLVSLDAGKINRKRLKSILSGQTADKVFTIIDGRK